VEKAATPEEGEKAWAAKARAKAKKVNHKLKRDYVWKKNYRVVV
jgi:hypothetical protein